MKPLTRRAEIRMGFRCNARCGFCYYQDALDTPPEQEPEKKEILRQLQRLRAMGANEVEFTGGEPTIKPHLADCIASAKASGFKNISLISNGLRLAKAEYCKRLVDAGLNDALLSIHGADASTHDEHTAIPGSFKAILQAAENLQANGVRLRASLTLTARNVARLPDILRLFQRLRVATIHIAVFSPVGAANATDQALRISYRDAGQALVDALDNAQQPLPPISIKYIPFCFVPGYESLVMNLYQQSFDPDDWNYYWSNKLRYGSNALSALLFDSVATAGFFLLRCRQAIWTQGFNAIRTMGFTRVVELLRKHHPKPCKRCRFFSVCDGVWRNYAAKETTELVEPVAGEPIAHPAQLYAMAETRQPGLALPSQHIPVQDISGL